ncbi:MAG: transposase [Candidatus Thiodiazotropha sp.]
MNELIPAKTPVKRRRFSKTFKAKIVAACDQPGASVAGVALDNRLNANQVHRWRRLAKAKTSNIPKQSDFLPIPLPKCVSDTSASVIIEVNGVKLQWPLAHMDQSIAWLRALQA